MKFKKIAAGVLSLAMAASLAGCGGSTTGDNAGNTTSAAADAGNDAGNDAAASSDNGSSDASSENEAASDVPSFSELYGDETIQLTVYSQLANYSGKLTGWFAELMKQKFNCEMTIIPEADGAFDTRMEAGNLGDIVIFGSNGSNYQRAALGGMLFDWNEDDILSDYGSYIKENMPYALQNNANLNDSFGAGNVVYGFGHNVATNPEDHEAFFYTMDVRWDLYKELGYPEVKTLDEFYDLMVKMKEICPTDEAGGETYATSLWPDWDGNMVMYVKAFATCYWGYDELGFGLYDVENGDFHYALEENGPYLQSLKFFNRLYQAGLLDPDSMTQTYNEMSEKVTVGGTFFSIFDYSGSALFNTEEHLSAGKAMYPVVPKDATPLCYGMNVLGGNRIWTIGANTEYPELCMAIINYLSTPEGYMTYWYGPKDVCWYYDEEGNTCFTELGEAAYKDRKGTNMPAEWGGISFDEGTFQANNTTWTKDASNPDSNGETYNCENWKSRRTDATYDILADWRNVTGMYNTQEYMDSVPHKVSLATSYSESDRSDDLKIIWEQVAKCIVAYSWQAIYAADDAEYDRIVSEMKTKCESYDPEGQCLAWCENEAALRCSLEDQVR
ncbi:MAG: extracellular solute-binding protein [Oscillospiraceae bacterium]|nr:extracellular solute-binding protein [Oscillospiraceae bacterium]